MNNLTPGYLRGRFQHRSKIHQSNLCQGALAVSPDHLLCCTALLELVSYLQLLFETTVLYKEFFWLSLPFQKCSMIHFSRHIVYDRYHPENCQSLTSAFLNDLVSNKHIRSTEEEFEDDFVFSSFSQ